MYLAVHHHPNKSIYAVPGLKRIMRAGTLTNLKGNAKLERRHNITGHAMST